MTTLREAALMALDALLWHYEQGHSNTETGFRLKIDQRAIRKLRAALAEERMAEPDAWRTEARNEHGLPVFFCASEVKQAGPGLIPLYTSPPQRGPIDDKTLWEMWVESPSDVLQFARAIERAHGIGSEE